MVARSRRANTVVFGFDFQVNAAIVLFLENVKQVEKMRLEGNYEDIEIQLDSGEMVMVQAKAVERASYDFKNVRKKLKEALISLSDADNEGKVRDLIFITNSPNPFNDLQSKSAFYGHSHRDYDSLPPTAKKIVDDYLHKINKPLDVNKLKIQVLPFETDDDRERYKVIMETINDFVGRMKINVPGVGRQLLETWHWQVFDNGGKGNVEIKLSKKDIIWPLLVKITEIEQCDEKFLEQFDTSVYEEVINRFSDIINSHCEQCEFFIKILSDYNAFKTDKKMSEKMYDFIEKYWNDYVSEFCAEDLEEEIQEAITKIVMHNIIRRKYAIDRIKKEVNLC